MPNVQCCHAQYYTRSSNYNNQWHKLIYDCWPLACFTDVDSWAQIWQVGFNLCCNSQSNIHYGYVPCDVNTCQRNNAWDFLCEFSTTTSNVYIDVVIFVILSCTMHCCFGRKIICTESFDYRINNLFGYSTYSFHLICCFSKFLKTIVLLRLWSFWNKCHNFSLK